MTRSLGTINGRNHLRSRTRFGPHRRPNTRRYSRPLDSINCLCLKRRENGSLSLLLFGSGAVKIISPWIPNKCRSLSGLVIASERTKLGTKSPTIFPYTTQKHNSAMGEQACGPKRICVELKNWYGVQFMNQPWLVTGLFFALFGLIFYGAYLGVAFGYSLLSLSKLGCFRY